MAGAALLLLSLAGAHALRDVPLGECYDCEVTCFEDCQLKFQREIIVPDNHEIDQLIGGSSFLQLRGANHTKAKHNHTANPNRSHVFNRRAAHPAKLEAEKQLIEHGNQFATCLKEEKCVGHPVSQASWVASGRDPSLVKHSQPCHGLALLKTGDAKKRCQVNDPSCATKCADKVTGQTAKPLSFVQDFPLHPVKVGVFSKGTINMDFCLKSCLTATCGCADAAGFDAKTMLDHVKKNKALGEPVKDTPPAWQYKKATLAECAKGVFGQKITSGLFVNYGGGWQEVCSDEFLTTTLGAGVDIGPTKKKCASTADDAYDYGCIWNNEENQCVVGFQTIAKCYVRYHDDVTRINRAGSFN